ncbi:MAG: preprotein translocase subunit YajC [Pseudomonadota bacterium]
MFESLAHAMSGAPGNGQGGAGGGLAALAPLIIMFVIFYFLLIRPQQKKAKQHREMLGSLKKGDRIVTSGGLFGEITGLTDTVATIEIAPKIRVKVARSHVSGLTQPGQQAPAPAEDK